VDAADYMLSICGDEALRELCSPGKSGSFFYLTNDDRYMIKTMKKAEVKVSVFNYLTFLRNQGSLIFCLFKKKNKKWIGYIYVGCLL